MKSVVTAFKFLLIFTILTGIAYPCFITVLSQLLFHNKANGSLLIFKNNVVGSELIGQQFDSVIYFSSRPSTVNYNTMSSGASNFGLTNAKLKNLVFERRTQFISTNHLDSTIIIPSEMLFASASGLDPHISSAAALLQVDRIAKARNFNESQRQILQQMIVSQSKTSEYFNSGREMVNVLHLNMEADKIK